MLCNYDDIDVIMMMSSIFPSATPVQATPTTVDDVMSGSRSDGASEERVTPKTTFSSKTDREEKGLKSRKLLSIREMVGKQCTYIVHT